VGVRYNCGGSSTSIVGKRQGALLTVVLKHPARSGYGKHSLAHSIRRESQIFAVAVPLQFLVEPHLARDGGTSTRRTRGASLSSYPGGLRFGAEAPRNRNPRATVGARPRGRRLRATILSKRHANPGAA